MLAIKLQETSKGNTTVRQNLGGSFYIIFYPVPNEKNKTT